MRTPNKTVVNSCIVLAIFLAIVLMTAFSGCGIFHKTKDTLKETTSIKFNQVNNDTIQGISTFDVKTGIRTGHIVYLKPDTITKDSIIYIPFKTEDYTDKEKDSSGSKRDTVYLHDKIYLQAAGTKNSTSTKKTNNTTVSTNIFSGIPTWFWIVALLFIMAFLEYRFLSKPKKP